MRAVQLDKYGPAENFKIVDAPIPEPKEGEVLIKVEAAGLIFADTQMRRGDYVNLPPSLPFIPGREVAGTVDKVGAKVEDIRPGMRVMALTHTGGYAEYATAPIGQVVHLPDRVSFLQGLVYNINLRVAYLCYYTFGRVQPNETVLLHAASGGIGTLIMQIAKKRGNNVIIALASSEEKLEYCRANGADYLINYRAVDYVDEVLRITGAKGVDVSLNSVGGPTLQTDPRAIRRLGRWVINGYAAGKGVIDPYEVIMYKALNISIFSIYALADRPEPGQAKDFLDRWLHTEDLISVTKTFQLEDVTAAHHWLEGQHSYGKIALVM